MNHPSGKFFVALMLGLGGLLCGPGLWAQEAASIPRPEHPTPQMQRAEWQSLNGTWEFAETDDETNDQFLSAAPYAAKIVVPFCRESKLSGLERTGFIKNVWYRRSFAIPGEWKSPRVLLHIGACDWKAGVWVNGELLAEHTGASSPITVDITRVARRDGENSVVIHAFDDTRGGLQPTGKQSHEEKSHGCVYTRTTGIWQSVWLEGVGDAYIREVFVTPDPDNGRALIRAEIANARPGLELAASAFAGDAQAGSDHAVADGHNQAYLSVTLNPAHLWTLEDPFLYGLKFVLKQGDQTVDAVDSYFGLRQVSIQGAAILINHKAVFQRLVLDQGFYPEGIWTAPTEEALKHDIELSMAAGFNGARLHQKVFEPRFLYWADKLGYIVWGEYTSWGATYGKTGADLPFLNDWLEVVRRDRNHPSIVGWCPFNETGKVEGPIQNSVVYATRQADPTRPILDTSGYVHSLSDPEVLDFHDYNQDPASFRSIWASRLSGMPMPPQYGQLAVAPGVPFFISEYGGIGWNIHESGWGYGNAPKSLDAFYERFTGLSNALLDNRHMFGFCYTQLTDIEQEQNGIYTYDRQPKFDCARLKAVLSREAAYEKDPPVADTAKTATAWQILVGANPDGAQAHPWRYTSDAPGDAWMQADFDDAAWQTGPGGFGKKEHWEGKTGTAWTANDIWLRQTFACENAAFAMAAIVVHYDNDAQVYVNGKPVWNGTGWNDDYALFDVADALRGVLRAGTNTIAVHCHQETGGQFIDVALLVAR